MAQLSRIDRLAPRQFGGGGLNFLLQDRWKLAPALLVM
jgi:hypothetical protein